MTLQQMLTLKVHDVAVDLLNSTAAIGRMYTPNQMQILHSSMQQLHQSGIVRFVACSSIPSLLNGDLPAATVFIGRLRHCSCSVT